MSSPTGERLLKPEVLGRMTLLNALAPEELAGLASQMWVDRFGKGEIVLRKESTSDALMFLLTGRLQVVDYTPDGKEIGLNLFSPGSHFGELALIDGQPRSASIMAIEPASVGYLPRDAALQLIYRNPLIAEQMLKHFAASIRNLTIYRSLLAIPQARQRLYTLLNRLQQAERGGRLVVPGLHTERQIAIMINTSRETVSRVLAALQRQGILRKEKRLLLIVDPAALARLAQGEHGGRETST